MKKLGNTGLKCLKILHIISIALWFGGIMSLLTLRSGMQLSSYDEVNATYHSMRSIDELLIRNGAQGILLTSIIYSIWTNWGFFKHRWVTVKWIVFIGQMILGIFFLNRWVGANVSILAAEKDMALNNTAFLQNNSFIQVGIITQIILVILLIFVSVFKPWKKKATAS